MVRQSASTVVSALGARSAAGLNLRARSSALGAGLESAVQGVRGVSNLRARSWAASVRGGSQICEHGRQRSTVQGVRWGSQSVSTVVCALSARSAVGLKSASTVVGALSARSAVGLKSASTVVSALLQGVRVGLESASTVVSARCKECGGSQICEHGRHALTVRSAVGLESASTVVALSVQGVRWISICEQHGRRLSARSAVGLESASTVVSAHRCKECGARSQICEHGRQRCKCKECGGASICEHGRLRYRCKECGVSRK